MSEIVKLVTDGATLAASAYVGKELAGGTKAFLSRLLGPAVDEFGLALSEKARNWRTRNIHNTLEMASNKATKNNIPTGEIKPKIFFPLIDSVSLEDDEDLQEVWANLLVNLSDTRKNLDNHIFPYILSQLSKNEYYFLLTQYKNISSIEAIKRELPKSSEQGRIWYGAGWSAIYTLENELKSIVLYKKSKTNLQAAILNALESYRHRLSLTDKSDLPSEADMEKSISDYYLAIDESLITKIELQNIMRLNLVKYQTRNIVETSSEDIPEEPDEDGPRSKSIDYIKEVDIYTYPVLTELGISFIEACQLRS